MEGVFQTSYISLVVLFNLIDMDEVLESSSLIMLLLKQFSYPVMTKSIHDKINSGIIHWWDNFEEDTA